MPYDDRNFLAMTGVVNVALDASLPVLACPLCTSPLHRNDTTLRCDSGHDFDLARHGYASLTTGGGPHFVGDTTAMVAARQAHLGSGHYRAIAEAVAAASMPHVSAPNSWVVELAGGTGYYISHLLDASPTLRGITLDVSKPAARAAAKAHPRLASVTGDARALLPLRTGSIAVVLSVFGPRSGDEIARILTPVGVAVVVTPRENHLIELREQFGLLGIGSDKQSRLETALLPLRLLSTTDVDYRMTLNTADIVNSIMMGPNAFHNDQAGIEAKALALPAGQQTTVAVTVNTFGR